MRAKQFVLAIGICFLATTAWADEIIYFSNGTYMKILAHEVRGDMIKVTMDGNGSMGFPRKMVDKIESGAVVVYGGPTSVFPNQMAPRAPGMEFQARSDAVVGVRSQAAKDADPDSMMRRAQASRMQATELLSGKQAESNFQDGRIMSTFAPGPAGTTRVGSHLVVGSGLAGHELPFHPTRLQMKAEVPPPPPADTPKN